ncbi:MAG: erythromycin esterase [Halobacteriales archaeon]|jgi:erythromycin esterase
MPNDTTTDGQHDHESDEKNTQTPDPGVVDALADAVTPLTTTDPDDPPDDLDDFGDAVEDATIVGLGEATHGTREFFELKARMIRYCIEELGTRTIALEANAGETLAIHDYVVHGKGNPREALEAVYFWTWNVETVLDLLEWLRSFNAGRPLEDRVRFHGFDAQYTQGSVDGLLAYFDRVDPEFCETIREELAIVADDGTPPHNDDAIEDRIAANDRVLPRVRDRLDDRREAYVDRAGEREWALANRHCATIDRALNYRTTMTDADGEDFVGDDSAVIDDMLRTRERAMADGVDWILDRTEEEPLVCWAHDDHVATAEKYDSDAGVPAMGGFLEQRHGEDYLALGFTFDRGSFQAIGDVPGEVQDEDGAETAYELRECSLDDPLPGTIDATFDAIDEEIGLLDCRAARENDCLAEWLTTERPHHSVGALFDAESPEEHVKPYAPGEAFDLLVHVAETTASRPVDDR